MSTIITEIQEIIEGAQGWEERGHIERAGVFALIAIAKSLAVIADKLEYTHPPSYHTADEEG